MNIQIIGDGVEVTDKIRKLVDNKISQKLEKLLSPFSPEMKTATMRIQRQARTGDYIVDLDMMLPGKEHIFAKTTHTNITTALTGLEEQAEKQIKRYRESLTNYSLG